MSLDKIPDRSNIDSCGVDVQSLQCAICESGIENSSHFFLCTLALEFWY